MVYCIIISHSFYIYTMCVCMYVTMSVVYDSPSSRGKLFNDSVYILLCIANLLLLLLLYIYIRVYTRNMLTVMTAIVSC